MRLTILEQMFYRLGIACRAVAGKESNQMLNILTEPMIRVDQGGGAAVWVSLPETYALLMADQVAAFPALRPHQRHAWHAFLCQLGAIALHRAGESAPPGDTEDWRALLWGLTADWPEDEPWQLVVADITQPALLQPPASSAAKAAEFKNRVATPDELDMLVTSKNHDLKGAVVSAANADDWLFALVTLQTMGGYSAAGKNSQYHTISRVSGTAGSRIAFSLTPSERLGIHIKRDIAALLEVCQDLIEKYDFAPDGVDLMWRVPWDGEKAIQLDELNPFYIEVCRRIRLYRDENGRVFGKRVGSKARRVKAEDLKGVVGDPWHPIRRGSKGDIALRLTYRDAFGYRQIARCLNPAEYELPPIFLTESERRTPEPMFLLAKGVVSYPVGPKAETQGYAESFIPLNLSTLRILGRPAGVPGIGEIAKSRIEAIDRLKGILQDALASFIAQGKDIYQLNSLERRKLRDRRELEPWLKRIEELVEKSFFDDLQTEFVAPEGEREGVRNRWLNEVIGHAECILKDAAKGLPCPSIHYYKALTQANEVFRVRVRGRNGFPNLYQKPDTEEVVECQTTNPPETPSNPAGAQMSLFK